MIDINLNEGAPTINKDIDLIIQQVDLLFDTTKKEVIGSPYYGTDHEEYLFNLNISNAAIERDIYNDITSLELFGFEPSVQCNILEGTLNDIILITIGLYRKSDNQYYEKTYKYQ